MKAERSRLIWQIAGKKPPKKYLPNIEHCIGKGPKRSLFFHFYSKNDDHNFAETVNDSALPILQWSLQTWWWPGSYLSRRKVINPTEKASTLLLPNLLSFYNNLKEGRSSNFQNTKPFYKTKFLTARAQSRSKMFGYCCCSAPDFFHGTWSIWQWWAYLSNGEVHMHSWDSCLRIGSVCLQYNEALTSLPLFARARDQNATFWPPKCSLQLRKI